MQQIEIGKIDPKVIARFWNNVNKTQTCWIWKGVPTNGYGYLSVGSRPSVRYLVHRFSYSLLVGKIPDGLQIDHKCRNRLCVNPDHLEAVTQKENVLRGIGFSAINSKKLHCKRGHEFNSTNTYVYQNGKRLCKICQNITRNKLRATKKGSKNRNIQCG